MHPVELAQVNGGLVGTAVLMRNCGRKAVRRALREGLLVHVGRDRYALPTTDEALEIARSSNGYLLYESAALHWGWEVRLPPVLPKVGVPRGRPAPAGTVRVDVRREALDGWATGRLQTALMCAADLPFADGLAVVDSALRHQDLTEQDLRDGALALPGERGVRARHVVRLASGLAANPFESALRACAVESGLEVVPQFRMQVGDLVFHPDLANPLLGIAIEAESWEFHGKVRAEFNRDCARYSAMTSIGWRVLRFTWREVMREPEKVVSTIRATAELARTCTC
ncbi:DUF559 domain-containing protein [Nocardioides sp. Kera G14]|uniref:DUF559 domain-containing protein n=1 Tax=Nocardioides sp. Kera G14 TaxID=2884264 RepID=UPI001D1117A2|nr:DUF559 domain-containing protein [Nocardioides sp. Kera G14]UDY22913.1 endonuclease domain-containing protein [Nocardioides sp. Kera G14]